MKRLSVLLSLLTFFVVSCKPELQQEQPEQDPLPGNPSRVCLETRVVDGIFEKNDEVGVYMTYGNLASKDNYFDNVRFTLSSGEWVSSSDFYWKDDITPASFYGYYPYDSSISNTLAYDFVMPLDQSAEDIYKSGDFLWGSACDVIPSSSAVELTLNHIMSKVTLTLKAGAGFSDSELLDRDLVLSFNNVVNEAEIDLSNGKMTLKNNVGSVIPYKIDASTYAFHMIPQSIGQCELISVVIGGSRYVMNRSFSCEGGKSYNCTLTLTRNQGGINIGIGSWDIVEGDLGGIVN